MENPSNNEYGIQEIKTERLRSSSGTRPMVRHGTVSLNRRSSVVDIDKDDKFMKKLFQINTHEYVKKDDFYASARNLFFQPQKIESILEAGTADNLPDDTTLTYNRALRKFSKSKSTRPASTAAKSEKLEETTIHNFFEREITSHLNSFFESEISSNTKKENVCRPFKDIMNQTDSLNHLNTYDSGLVNLFKKQLDLRKKRQILKQNTPEISEIKTNMKSINRDVKKNMIVQKLHNEIFENNDEAQKNEYDLYVKIKNKKKHSSGTYGGLSSGSFGEDGKIDYCKKLVETIIKHKGVFGVQQFDDNRRKRMREKLKKEIERKKIQTYSKKDDERQSLTPSCPKNNNTKLAPLYQFPRSLSAVASKPSG